MAATDPTAQEGGEQQRYEQLNQLFQDILSEKFWNEGKLDAELFNEVFIDRQAEIARFQQVCGSLHGRSVLFVGRAGVGKSGLQYKLHNLINSGEMFRSHRKVISVIFDLENKEKVPAPKLLLEAATLLRDRYLEVVAPGENRDLNELTEPIPSIHRVAGHMRAIFLKDPEAAPHLFFFIDDLDYATHVWYDLVMGLSTIISLPSVSAVLSVRHELGNQMFGNRDLRIKRMVQDASRIDLPPLPIAEVLTRRLLDDGPRRRHKWFQRLVTSYFTSSDELAPLLEAAGLRRDGHFAYPFAEKLERFLVKTTNGNAREMLAMAKTCLQYIVNNRRTFNRSERDGLYHFERPLVLKLFGKYHGSPIVNLYDTMFMSHWSGNLKKPGYPLLLNILEWLGYGEPNEENRKHCFKELGHTEERVGDAITQCVALGLIEPRLEAPACDPGNTMLASYELSPKGKYHLTHMITWAEYDEEFGDYRNRSVPRKFLSAGSCAPEMFFSLVEFLLYLATAIREVNPLQKTVRLHLPSLIKWYADYQTTYLSPTLQEKFWPDNPDPDHMVDEYKVEYLLSNPPIKLQVGGPILTRGKYQLTQRRRDQGEVGPPKDSQHPETVEIKLDAVFLATKQLGFEKQSRMPTKERCDFAYFLGLVKTHCLAEQAAE